jgi:hypothetical protein
MTQRLREEPSRENVAALHELHARHLREVGEHERADRADERARTERALLRDGTRRDER